ncbi:TetR/AcrR family transcriptional regulator [Kitasatospora sp. MAP5-34]|uniref:TetR/AcrR family transcriptional regulator n=1 Tax=Kitasatospora sp. MAP5-34 TaxID=3035102 RepID=UPI0024751088|nr:TetR/AcrR family transcriptional regulator [Kitasatospora sp. MAP5-34]MDH6579925.1 AcrR family transcriptional regulator [Kitasatospora sp. MAP5-34]
MNETGRRAQHKAATREALHQAALRMFEERGYDATTVKDIAAAASVTERTFFRYFPSKEDLVLGELSDLVPLLAEGIRRRPADEPPLRAVLAALLTVGGERGSGFAVLFSGPPARFVSAPTRPGRPVLFEFETGIAEALHARMGGAGPVSLRASVLARAAVAAMRSALIAHADLEGERPFPAAIVSLLDEAFAALESPG